MDLAVVIFSCASVVFFFQAEDGIRDDLVTGVQTCALPICKPNCRGKHFRPQSEAPEPGRVSWGDAPPPGGPMRSRSPRPPERDAPPPESPEEPAVHGRGEGTYRGRPPEPRLAPSLADTHFELKSDFAPGGDQPRAVGELVAGIERGDKHQVLLGVTGSGKTFTIASALARGNRPALVLAHNNTLAAQLYQEFSDFFPRNAVEYFVSYYDYYQPEAYVPQSDTYIEKEATINDEIDRMRLSATRSLFERRDVVIVASVSCIYGLG